MAMSQYTREETFQRSTGGLANRFKFIFEIKYSTNSTFHLNKRIFQIFRCRDFFKLDCDY